MRSMFIRGILLRTQNFYLLEPFSLIPCSSEQHQRRFVHHHKEFEQSLELYLGVIRSNPNRANRNTHTNEKKFHKLRGQKTVQIELDDDVEIRAQKDMTPDQLRISLLRKGINPYKEVSPREWNEHQITFQSFYGLVDPYVAPERAPKFQELEGSNVWQKLRNRGSMILKDKIMHRYNSYVNGLKRIKRKEGFTDFDPKKFEREAEKIYEDAHMALCERNKNQLHKLITEQAYAKLWPDVQHGSVQWKLLRFYEPSKVVSIRCLDNPHKSGNDIAQIIVRMHSEQIVAIFDRFGHLLLGSPTKSIECLEYVVFENHIASMDGIWRFHDKVYPKWLEPKSPVNRPSLIDQNDPKRPVNSVSLQVNLQSRIKKAENKTG